MSNDLGEINSINVGATQMANILSVTDRTVRSLAQEKVIIKVDRGKYNLVQSVKNYIVQIKSSKGIKEIESKKVESVDSVTVSATAMANLLSVTDRTVRNLAQENILVRTTTGKYDLAQSIRNYVVHLKTNKNIKDVKDENIDLERERALHEAIKRKKTELQVRVMEGDLHYAKDVELVMTDMLAVFRNRIMNIGGKLAPTLIGQTELADIEDLINGECISALDELSEYDPTLFWNEDCIDLEDDIIDEENEEENA